MGAGLGTRYSSASPPWPVAFLVLRSSACPRKPWRMGAERRRKAPVRNGGTVPLGRAAAAAPVRNSTTVPGKAAFDRFDRLTAGKAQTRKAMPHGEFRGSLPYTKAKILFREGVPTSTWSFGTNRSHFLRTLGAQCFSLRTQTQERTENAG